MSLREQRILQILIAAAAFFIIALTVSCESAPLGGAPSEGALSFELPGETSASESAPEPPVKLDEPLTGSSGLSTADIPVFIPRGDDDWAVRLLNDHITDFYRSNSSCGMDTAYKVLYGSYAGDTVWRFSNTVSYYGDNIIVTLTVEGGPPESEFDLLDWKTICFDMANDKFTFTPAEHILNLGGYEWPELLEALEKRFPDVDLGRFQPDKNIVSIVPGADGVYSVRVSYVGIDRYSSSFDIKPSHSDLGDFYRRYRLAYEAAGWFDTGEIDGESVSLGGEKHIAVTDGRVDGTLSGLRAYLSTLFTPVTVDKYMFMTSENPDCEFASFYEADGRLCANYGARGSAWYALPRYSLMAEKDGRRTFTVTVSLMDFVVDSAGREEYKAVRDDSFDYVFVRSGESWLCDGFRAIW